jgi:hypothetical protein
MAAKKKTKKTPKKTKKERKRLVKIPVPFSVTSGECQTRGSHCEIRPGIFRSAPKPKKAK